MPIFFQQDLDENTRLAIWHIEEGESFFDVPLQREITHPHKRLQHLAGRFILRYLFPDFPLKLIKIADTKKPYLADEAYHFSISHCGDYAAAIVSKNKRVGIDVEVPNEKVYRIKEKFLHPDELQEINNNDPDEHLSNISQLTLLWSAKESVFKWWSYGGVDFSEMIRLKTFGKGNYGIIQSAFIHNDINIPLNIHYKTFESICLTFVADDTAFVSPVFTTG